MDVRNSFIIGGCVVVAGFIIGAAIATRPVVPAEPVGRFQIAGSPGHAFVVDTATGKVWESFEAETMGGTTAGFSDPKPTAK